MVRHCTLSTPETKQRAPHSHGGRIGHGSCPFDRIRQMHKLSAFADTWPTIGGRDKFGGSGDISKAEPTCRTNNTEQPVPPNCGFSRQTADSSHERQVLRIFPTLSRLNDAQDSRLRMSKAERVREGGETAKQIPSGGGIVTGAVMGWAPDVAPYQWAQPSYCCCSKTCMWTLEIIVQWVGLAMPRKEGCCRR